jgi:hypothetical protein
MGIFGNAVGKLELINFLAAFADCADFFVIVLLKLTKCCHAEVLEAFYYYFFQNIFLIQRKKGFGFFVCLYATRTSASKSITPKPKSLVVKFSVSLLNTISKSRSLIFNFQHPSSRQIPYLYISKFLKNESSTD